MKAETRNSKYQINMSRLDLESFDGGHREAVVAGEGGGEPLIVDVDGIAGSQVTVKIQHNYQPFVHP